MADPTTKIRFTYDDYRSLPQSDTKRYELLGGELIMVPSPSTHHQRICRNLGYLVWQSVRDSAIGELLHAPCDVVLGEGIQREVVQPDLVFVSKERIRIITDEEIRGAPDLVIEVTSPATEERDRHYKRTLYARHGVREYWIVDSKLKTVEIYSLGDQGFRLASSAKYTDRITSPILPELSVDLREVF